MIKAHIIYQFVFGSKKGKYYALFPSIYTNFG